MIGDIKGSIELWPALVEMCYFQKARAGLPMVRVDNHSLSTVRRRTPRDNGVASGAPR